MPAKGMNTMDKTEPHQSLHFSKKSKILREEIQKTSTINNTRQPINSTQTSIYSRQFYAKEQPLSDTPQRAREQGHQAGRNKQIDNQILKKQ